MRGIGSDKAWENSVCFFTSEEVLEGEWCEFVEVLMGGLEVMDRRCVVACYDVHGKCQRECSGRLSALEHRIHHP